MLQELGSDFEAAKTILVLIKLRLKMVQDIDRKPLKDAIHVFEKLGAEIDLAEARDLAGELK